MKRREFLRNLKTELKKRRDIEVEEVLFYYDELIQDAIDSGETEEIFIANLGSVEDILRRLVDEEEFIISVKKKNDKVVREVLDKTVKIIGYFVYGIVAFTLVVVSFSVFMSGLGVVGLAIFRLITTTPVDSYGYFAILGIALIGLSLLVLGIAVVKWLFNNLTASLLVIFRNINNFFNRKGK
ncbi:MAG: DUF1700 domain-containing protein [Tenericutes bacterium]|nr:DUF1700 domain-containing protein [Mycoplasmatota bacterium]